MRTNRTIHFGSLGLCLVIAILASDATQRAVQSASAPDPDAAADSRTCAAVSTAAHAGLNGFRPVLAASPWNAGVGKAALVLNPSGDPLMGNGAPVDPDFGSADWRSSDTDIFYVVADSTQRPVKVSRGAFGSDIDSVLAPGAANDGRHALIVDGSNCWLYELWSAYPQKAAGLGAHSGTVWGLLSSGRAPVRPAGTFE
jgi:hypothetical protein